MLVEYPIVIGPEKVGRAWARRDRVEWNRRSRRHFWPLPACWLVSLPARADEEAKRPEIRTNRWQEDWSALADPALRTEPFDAIKYIPIMPGIRRATCRSA